MSSFKGRQSAGAPGGYWEVFDEQPEPRVVRQFTETSCGAACAEMLFKLRGIADILQEMIIKAQGDEWSFSESLTAAMNKLQQESGTGLAVKWKGAWVDTIRSPRQTFDSLAKRGSSITSLKSFASESNMVVIDGIDDRDRIVVLDPWKAPDTRWNG